MNYQIYKVAPNYYLAVFCSNGRKTYYHGTSLQAMIDLLKNLAYAHDGKEISLDDIEIDTTAVTFISKTLCRKIGELQGVIAGLLNKPKPPPNQIIREGQDPRNARRE